MRSLLLLLATAPVLVYCSRFGLGGCGRFSSRIDPFARSVAGMNMISEVMRDNPYMFLWDSFSAEETNKKHSLMVDLTANTALYSFTDELEEVQELKGTAYYWQVEDPYLEIGFVAEKKGQYRNVLGANKTDGSKLYPAYISPDEVLFYSCGTSFLGHHNVLYAFTRRDLSYFYDKTCSIATVKEATGHTAVDPDYEPEA